jgi:hypothetical protein
MEAELQQLRQHDVDRQRDQQQRDAQTATDTATQAVNMGIQSFNSRHQLDPADTERLSRTVMETGVLPGIVSSQNGNIAAAMDRAMEMVYWSDPSMQTRELNTRLESEREEATERVNRKRRASSVATSGGNVSRQAPAPTTADGRKQAMADEIRQSMAGVTEG